MTVACEVAPELIDWICGDADLLIGLGVPAEIERFFKAEKMAILLAMLAILA